MILHVHNNVQYDSTKHCCALIFPHRGCGCCRQILAAVRAGLLSVAASSEEPSGGDAAEDFPVLPAGTPGHSDILREASHYLSAIKVL